MNSKVRLRRLQSDWEEIQKAFKNHKYITVEPTKGNPPEKYSVTYRNILGIENENFKKRDLHKAEITLDSDYPMHKPGCVLKTPIYHPNFGTYICIGDNWSAGETLVDIILKIGNMIQYKDYNPKSPLNSYAAEWSVHNKSKLPISNIELTPAEEDEDEIEIDFMEAKNDDDFSIELS